MKPEAPVTSAVNVISAGYFFVDFEMHTDYIEKSCGNQRSEYDPILGVHMPSRGDDFTTTSAFRRGFIRIADAMRDSFAWRTRPEPPDEGLEESILKTSRPSRRVDLFEKCYNFTRADDLKAIGLYPYFKPISRNLGPVVTIDGREIIMAGSNNYLGLTTHPKVMEAARSAIERYGSGCSGSRYLNGTLDIHVELEEKLAEFMKKEACLLFSTGYQTNQGVIATLVQKGEYVITDKDNHASIVAGTLMAKGLFADIVRYKHNDMQDLQRVISRIPVEASKLFVTDGVFSMSGSIVNLPELVRIAKQNNARVMVDDAHGIGVLGRGGLGTADHFGLHDEVDLIMGTFSKTFASLGGFVAGERQVVDYIKHHSAALIFSASMTPAAVAAVPASLEILKSEPERIAKLHRNAAKMRNGFTEMGFRILPGETAVVPVVIGDDLKTFMFWRDLFEAGVFVNAVISPAVPPGMQLLRTSFMATHEDEHLDRVLDTFLQVGRKLQIIQ